MIMYQITMIQFHENVILSHAFIFQRFDAGDSGLLHLIFIFLGGHKQKKKTQRKRDVNPAFPQYPKEKKLSSAPNIHE